MWRPAILQKAEAALLDEKAAKLKSLARLLDDQLGPSFDALVVEAGVAPDGPPQARLDALQRALRPATDRLAAAFPNVGLGYFDRRLDRIVAYAPHARLGGLVGVVVPPDHLGRLAMARRAVRIAIGSMVRGDAMNCMHPLIRDGEVIGFAFANESVEDIYRQIQSRGGRGSPSLEIPTTFGLSALAVFASSASLSADAIRTHLGQAVAAGQLDQVQVLPLLQALGQVDQYVRLFLDNLGIGVLIVDDQGRVSYANEPMARICARVRGELQGCTWADLIARLGLELEPDPYQLADQEEQRLLRGMLRGCSVSGREGPVAVDLLVAGLPGLPGYRLYLVEETDRMRRDSGYFERAERLALAGELATAIAHEIRNPLTVVAGSIQLIPDRVGDQEFLCSLARIAGQELGRVNRIIQGLLGFARYAEPERSLLDVNGLIRQVSEFLGWYARKREVDLRLELAPGPLTVYGDGEHLKQALLNLVMNGIQAMSQGGSHAVAQGGSHAVAQGGGMLLIRTDLPSGSRRVRIDICDQGPGIPEEQQAKIWEVFYSNKPGGTGLGLPVVQRIIDAHRGYIEVLSTPGEGTCFSIFLPVTNRSHPTRREDVVYEPPPAGG